VEAGVECIRKPEERLVVHAQALPARGLRQGSLLQAARCTAWRMAVASAASTRAAPSLLYATAITAGAAPRAGRQARLGTAVL
jgi:hypothetical protein